MLHITNSFTANADGRTIKVFITDIILDYKDKAVLKHLVNSNVDITKLYDINEARNLAETLDAQHKLVTSQKDVNIRYQKWSLAKASATSESVSKPCDDPSIGPDHIYNKKTVAAVTAEILNYCKAQKYKSFLPAGMLHICTARALYGKRYGLDKQQLAMVRFVKEYYAKRYLVVSPFRKEAYNLGSELMLQMFPDGVRYRAEQYTNGMAKSHRTYFILLTDRMINSTTGEVTMIPAGTFLERSKERYLVDSKLFYSNKA